MPASKQPHASFTLMELLVAAVVVMILASVATVGYQGYVDRAAILQDETNMMILQVAVKVNAIQTGTVAGSISDLRHVDFEKAYAMVSGGKRPYTLFAYAAERCQLLWGNSVAEAADLFLPAGYYHRDLRVLTCAKDPAGLARIQAGFDAAGRPIGGSSYGIHKKLKGKPISALLQSSPNRVLIYEADGAHKETYRHRGYQAVRVTVSGKATRKRRGDNDSDPPDGDGD